MIPLQNAELGLTGGITQDALQPAGWIQVRVNAAAGRIFSDIFPFLGWAGAAFGLSDATEDGSQQQPEQMMSEWEAVTQRQADRWAQTHGALLLKKVVFVVVFPPFSACDFSRGMLIYFLALKETYFIFTVARARANVNLQANLPTYVHLSTGINSGTLFKF